MTRTQPHFFRVFPVLALLALALLSFMPGTARAQVEGEKETLRTWEQIASRMELYLNRGYDAFRYGDVEEGKRWINEAYFGYYERHGFERTVMARISGQRGRTVERQFIVIKQQMTRGEPLETVRGTIDQTVTWLYEDAAFLDGRSDAAGEKTTEAAPSESSEGGAWLLFLSALGIILREGVEAILVIAAIAAYLVRSGNRARVRMVYLSAGAAIAASFAAWFAMRQVITVSGAQQEIIEGVSMLLAAVVLAWVSNWMFSKAEGEAWKHYIEGKVHTAVESGSGFALGAAAFLAVFREGVETILFYQALLAGEAGSASPVWIGFLVGCVLLVGVWAVIRFGSMRLPLKPFFIGTSLLLYIMAIVFAGNGVLELMEGDVLAGTPVPGVPTIDLVGIHPYVETLLPQIILLFLGIASVLWIRRKNTQPSAA